MAHAHLVPYRTCTIRKAISISAAQQILPSSVEAVLVYLYCRPASQIRMQMSTSKTLSNGTLGLRFMQNTLRAKQQAAVDLERAKVKDEAEWEVSREVREALGLGSASNVQTRQTIAQETSYLPFLFPSLHQNAGTSSNDERAAEAYTSTKISGRRTFAKGRELVSTPSSVDDPASGDADVKPEEDVAASFDPSTEESKSRSTRGGGPLTKARASKMAELDRSVRLPTMGTSASDVPVLSMISGETSAAVGMDMRQLRKLRGKETVSIKTEDEVKPFSSSAPSTGETVNSVGKGPLSFLRPAGVDSPTLSNVKGKRSMKRERDAEVSEASLGLSGKKADSESASIADGSESRRQTPKKQKKKLEPGLFTQSS